MKYWFGMLCLLLAGCQSKFGSEQQMHAWLNNPKHGLRADKQLEGLSLQVKYLPPDYLVYRELKGKPYNRHAVDSLRTRYQATRTFLLTVSFDGHDTPPGNVLFYGINDPKEYKRRIEALNFAIGDYVSVRAGGKEFRPLLSAFENLYTVGNKRTLYLVFGEDEHNRGLLGADTLDFTFQDWIFESGINHFVFNKEHLDNTPKIDFWAYQ